MAVASPFVGTPLDPWLQQAGADRKVLLEAAALEARSIIQERGERVLLWKPQPGPQTLAFESDAFETLYGGAAGGGKSDLLLGLARSEHRSAVVFRQTYPMLQDALIPRSQEIYGATGTYNENRHAWQFPDGCVIRFRHLMRESNLNSYQGSAFDFIGFDESTQFRYIVYIYLFSRCRTTIPGQRCRVLAATNPGGEGNEWTMDRWAAWLNPDHPNPAKPGELRWFVMAHQKGKNALVDLETPGPEPFTDPVTRETLHPKSRTFIPARLSDNRYLGQDYLATLQMLPEPYRSQLMNGDWTAGLMDDATQVIPSAWIKAAMARWADQVPRGTRLSAIGVDCARGGDDEMVVMPRYENWFAKPLTIAGAHVPDAPTALRHIVPIVSSQGSATINVDVIGVGSSVYDLGLMQGLDMEAINAAEASGERDRSGTLRLANKRAELWWRMREALDPASGLNLALPPDPKLSADLKAPRWDLRAGGIQIESKDSIRERIGRSTNQGDAAVMALHEPKRALSAARVAGAMVRGEPVIPEDAKRVVSVAISRADGSRALMARIVRGRVIVIDERLARGAMSEQAQVFEEMLGRSSGGSCQRGLILAETGEGDLAEHAYELGRLGLRGQVGWAASMGFTALEELLTRGELEIHPRCERLRLSLMRLRRLTATNAREQDKGASADFAFGGEGGWARAVFNLAFHGRAALREQVAPTPDGGRIEQRERLAEEIASRRREADGLQERDLKAAFEHL